VRSRAGWTFVGILLAGVLGLVLLGALTTPDPRGHGTHEQLGLPRCMFLEYTGIPCPGCGVTTAMSSFAHGEFGAAIRVQPFGVLIAAGIVLFFAIALLDTLRNKDAWAEFRRRWKPWMSWCLGVALLAAWCYKIAVTRA